MTEPERPSNVNDPSSAQRVLQPLQGSVQQTTPPSSSLSQAGAGTTSGTTASGENVLQSSSLGNAAGTNVPDNSSVSLEVPNTTVSSLKKELDEWKKKIDSSAIECALSTLQMVISRPAALFDPYAAIAALDEVVNVTKERKDERALRFEIVLRQCRPLLGNPCLQQVLIKLVASKDEAEVAKVISKATKQHAAVSQPSFTGRTRRPPAPYQRRGSNYSPRPPSARKCWVCGKAGHISRSCPDKR